MPRRVLVVVNRSKPNVRQAVDRVRSLIEKYAEFVADCDSFDETMPDVSKVDLILVLGGDGTLLAQARRFVSSDLPLIGVNMGTLGFLAEFDLDAFEKHAETLLVGDQPLAVHDRMLIDVSVFTDDTDSPTFVDVALNDAAITAGPPYRMIELGLSIDGTLATHVRGDGLIISTPLGSTGYAVSAGGPIISPDLQAMSITPIAAHSLAFRPIVVTGDSTIEIDICRANLLRPTDALPHGAHGTTLVLDGQRIHAIKKGHRIVLRRHPRLVHLVRNPTGSYWDTLVRKMHWAVAPGETGEKAR